MNRISTAAAAASVPPTVVAPTAPWTAQAARSRGPSFRASGVYRSSSASLSPITTSPSRTPIVAGTAPAPRTAASLASPTSIPAGAGKPWATSVVSSATTAPPLAERCLDLVGDPDQVLHASSLVVAAWDARRSARRAWAWRIRGPNRPQGHPGVPGVTLSGKA